MLVNIGDTLWASLSHPAACAWLPQHAYALLYAMRCNARCMGDMTGVHLTGIASPRPPPLTFTFNSMLVPCLTGGHIASRVSNEVVRETALQPDCTCRTQIHAKLGKGPSSVPAWTHWSTASFAWRC